MTYNQRQNHAYRTTTDSSTHEYDTDPSLGYTSTQASTVGFKLEAQSQSQSQQPLYAAQASRTDAPSRASQRNVIDDAQLKRMMKESRPSFTEKYGFCLVTLILIALNAVIYGVEVVLSDLSTSISSGVLFSMGAMFVPAISSPLDWYRFVAPMFLHVDLMHLLFNMAALYSVGVLLERVLGHGNFLLLYVIGGITGNALTYVTDFYTASYVLSAGASTSVFGLFVAAALLGVLSKKNRHVLRNYSKGMLSIIAINIVYTLLMPSVSLSGHLGGAIGGLIGMFIVPSKNLRVPSVVRIVVTIVWVLAVAHVLTMTLQGYFSF